eukprot:scaffold65019_cov25-Tisochrysis_lutea.AAC.2
MPAEVSDASCHRVAAGDEEEDEDFEAYATRMRRDGEWAGQPELLAAVQVSRPLCNHESGWIGCAIACVLAGLS